MPVSYITYKDRTILYVDLKGIKNKLEVEHDIHLMADFYKKATEDIYLLLDITGAYLGPEIADLFKTYGKTTFKGKSKKRAVLGITKLKAIILRGYSIVTNTEVKPFDSMEDAKDYLAS